ALPSLSTPYVGPTADGGAHGYAYVQNAPDAYVDPYGLEGFDLFGRDGLITRGSDWLADTFSSLKQNLGFDSFARSAWDMTIGTATGVADSLYDKGYGLSSTRFARAGYGRSYDGGGIGYTSGELGQNYQDLLFSSLEVGLTFTPMAMEMG